MFKGSKNVEPEEHTSVIASVGGQSNAYTTDDETVFWQTLPAQYLPLVLWLEADRMATLRIDKDTFINEREVVKEERRMRVDNQPYGRLNEIIYDQAFTTHPYKHPTIGSMADLEAASIDDVREFYNTYLRAGERDAGASSATSTRRRRRQLVDAVFRPRAEGGSGRCRATSRRSRRRRRRSGSRVEAPWPLPAVVVAYHITYDGHPDSYPLHIASKVLSDGQSSRIYQKLVYEKQLAVAAFGGGQPRSRIRICSTPSRSSSRGRRRRRPSAALIAELDRLKAEPISEHELQRAKNQFARDYILGPRVEPAEGAAAGACGGHPQRHHDRRRRVRDLPGHHRGRRAARRAHLLHRRRTGWCITIMPRRAGDGVARSRQRR